MACFLICLIAVLVDISLGQPQSLKVIFNSTEYDDILGFLAKVLMFRSGQEVIIITTLLFRLKKEYMEF